MIIYVDIDGTICDSKEGYEKSTPIKENIAKINEMFGNFHTIIYWTARGRTTGKDWTELTRKQLSDWGCKYHELIMNQKPAYDLLIDDRAFKIDEL